MPPTLKDIASRANVSPALVSMYLNKNPKSRMSAETRQRIDAAIREMNYHPSALARSLRSGKSMTIGYATGNIVGTFSSFRTQMLLQEAYRFGYQLLISLVPFYDYAQEQKILNSLLDSQPAGILYNLDLRPDEETARRLKEYPILQMSGDNPAYNNFDFERQAAFEQAIELFCREGRRKLAVTVVANYGDWGRCITRTCREHDLEIVYIPDHVADNPKNLLEILSASGADSLLSYSSTIVAKMLHFCEQHEIVTLPACIYCYTLPTDYIAHPSIRGVIVNPFRESISECMKRMIEMIDNPAGPAEHRSLPAKFMNVTDLAQFYNTQLEDPYYEPILVAH